MNNKTAPVVLAWVSVMGLVGTIVVATRQPVSLDIQFFESTFEVAGYHYSLTPISCRAFAVMPDESATSTRMLFTARHCLEPRKAGDLLTITRAVGLVKMQGCIVGLHSHADLAILKLMDPNDASSAGYSRRPDAVATFGLQVLYLKHNGGKRQKAQGTNQTTTAGSTFQVKPNTAGDNLVPGDSGGPATIARLASGVISTSLANGNISFASIPDAAGWIDSTWKASATTCK